jgi:hypothetical protein
LFYKKTERPGSGQLLLKKHSDNFILSLNSAVTQQSNISWAGDNKKQE